MRFHRNMEWKSIQVKDWTNICVLNLVTWDLTEMWSENVSKYNIELISVYLKWKHEISQKYGMKINPS